MSDISSIDEVQAMLAGQGENLVDDWTARPFGQV